MSDLAALIARAKAAGMERVYPINEVPPSPGYPYAVMSLDTGRPVNRRAGGPASREIRGVTVDINARSHGELSDQADFADSAFKDKVLPELPDRPYSIRDVASRPYRDADDDGVLRIVHIYSFD